MRSKPIAYAQRTGGALDLDPHQGRAHRGIDGAETVVLGGRKFDADAIDARELRVAAEKFDKARNATLVRPETSPDSGEWHTKLASLLVGDKAEAV